MESLATLRQEKLLRRFPRRSPWGISKVSRAY